MRYAGFGLLLVALLAFITACGRAGNLDIYEITANPGAYNGQEVTIEGLYLWRAGDPGMSVLAKAVSTRDDGTDAQPQDTVIWLENFPADLTARLHRPIDSVYGAVAVRGRFESGGAFGPNGAYPTRLVVSSAEVLEDIQRIRHEAPRSVPAGQVSIYDLASDPGRFNGQTVTTQAFYYWTPATSGLLAEGVEVEEPILATAAGLNPQPLGAPLSMEGFPPDQSAALNVGPGNGFVWGLVEVTGTFQSGGQFGINGLRSAQLIIDPASVKPIK